MKNHTLLILLMLAITLNFGINWNRMYSDETIFISDETNPEKIIIPEKVTYIQLNNVTSLKKIVIPESAEQLKVPKLTNFDSFNFKNLISIFADNMEYKDFHYPGNKIKYVRLKNKKLYF